MFHLAHPPRAEVRELDRNAFSIGFELGPDAAPMLRITLRPVSLMTPLFGAAGEVVGHGDNEIERLSQAAAWYRDIDRVQVVRLTLLVRALSFVCHR
jgi:hypothetical protein